MTTAQMDTTGMETAGQSWAPRQKWFVCALLLGATALSYLDRQAFSVAAPLVRKELALDNAQLGLLLSAFFYAYSAMHIFVGWILDRFDTKRTYAGFVAAWSLAQVMIGLARGFEALFGARLALGAFETAGQTGAARIIARMFPSRDRAFAKLSAMVEGARIVRAELGQAD